MCKCNHFNRNFCHQCEESTGVCGCKCHDRLKVGQKVVLSAEGVAAGFHPGRATVHSFHPLSADIIRVVTEGRKRPIEFHAKYWIAV